MKVRYKDGPAALQVAGVAEVVNRGEAVEVDPEIGKQLVAQGWEQVGKSNAKEKD